MNSSSSIEEEDDDHSEEEDSNSESKSLWNIIWYILTTLLGGYVLMGRSSPLRYLFTRILPTTTTTSNEKRGGNTVVGSSFFDKLFSSPFLDDDERVRLRPISVNSYVHVYPTLQNEDGVFVKVFIENSSELATENI